MKYLVIGTSHAGYESVQTLLELEPEAEIHLFERGTTASFLSCGIQSYLEGISPSLDSLHYANVDSYRDQGVNVHIEADVTGLDPEAKTITYVQDGETHQMDYDKIMVSAGAVPVELPIDGLEDLDHVYYVRGRDWADVIKERMGEAKSAAVIGGGYIGIEVAEAFTKAGIKTVVIDAGDSILPTYLDKEFTDRLTKHAEDKGLTIHSKEMLKEVQGKDGAVHKIITDNDEHEIDTLVLAPGVHPDTKWLEGALDLNEDTTIQVDEYMRTSAPDVYAAGDATRVPFKPTGDSRIIALATNARRQGVVAASNMVQDQSRTMPAVSGTSGLALFDYHFACTGIKEADLKDLDLKVASKYVEEPIRPAFMQDDTKVYMKIYYEEDSHRILGGQLMSTEDITASIQTLSVAISAEWTLEDLAMADFFFQPGYNRPWNYLNVLALEALGTPYGSDKMLF